jgi:hypothetical protein
MEAKQPAPLSEHCKIADVAKLLRVSSAKIGELMVAGKLQAVAIESGDRTYRRVGTRSLIEAVSDLFAGGVNPFETLGGLDERLAKGKDGPRAYLDWDVLTPHEVGEHVGYVGATINNKIREGKIRGLLLSTGKNCFFRVTAGEMRKQFPDLVEDEKQDQVPEKAANGGERIAYYPTPERMNEWFRNLVADFASECGELERAARAFLQRTSGEELKQLITLLIG